MEKYQQASGSANADREREKTDFANRQPGQQLPAQNKGGGAETESPNGPEQHSESSRPQGENETLGTP